MMQVCQGEVKAGNMSKAVVDGTRMKYIDKIKYDKLHFARK